MLVMNDLCKFTTQQIQKYASKPAINFSDYTSFLSIIS